MSPQLLEKREMGCTTNELVKALLDDAVDIKGPTLNRYLCEYLKTHGEEPEADPKEAKKKAAKKTKQASPPDASESAEKPKPSSDQSAENGRDDSAAI